MVPPECWVRRTFPRRLVDLETYKLVTYQGAEKSSAWFWGGVVLLVVAVVATGGAAAFLYAAGAATVAATTAALTGAAALSGLIGKVAFDKGLELVREPDDWEIRPS